MDLLKKGRARKLTGERKPGITDIKKAGL